MAKVQSAVSKLEKASKEDQRAIFENLISFAEFHPTKLKLGVFVGSTTIKNGGESEIRTRETLSSLHAFQACGFNHSPISPRWSGSLET